MKTSKFIQKGKLSLFIELPDDELFFSEGLVDFIAYLGVLSSEATLNIFEEQKQENKLQLIPSTETTVSEEGNKIKIYYRSISELDQLFRDWIKNKPLNDLNEKSEVTYSQLEHLWTFHGTGDKLEAHPKQHLSFSFQINVKKSKELLKSICYIVLRLSLYSTSFEAPIIHNKKANVLFKIEESENEKFILQSNNTFLLESKHPDKILNHIAQVKHVSEGGIWGAWNHKLFEKPKIEKVLHKTWSSPSEANRLLNRLKKMEGDVEVFITANKEQRENFQQRIKNECEKVNNVKVYSAFKSGFYWLLEEVAPLYTKVENINIYCKNGAQLGNLELANRWVMELYPVDEMLAQRFQIDKEAIQFHLVDEQDEIYKVVINDDDCYTFSPLIDTFYYVDGKQQVSPITAGIRSNEGQWIIDTDRKSFYQYLLHDIMPEIEKLIEQSKGDGITSPLFEKLEIVYEGAGIEEELPVKNELNSSLEALYEDLYFNLLDYFKILGRKKVGKLYTSPGGIIPKMYLSEDIYKNVTGEISLFVKTDVQKETMLKSITFNEKGQMNQFHFSNNKTFHVSQIENVSIPEHLKQLESPISKVVYVNHSYLRRSIFAVECAKRHEQSFISGIKKSNEKHTVIIETGHHANEVSSIPAAEKLIKKLQNEYSNYLNKMNVIIILNANPDGEALLRQLTKDHPKWKHHAARFNAVGLEFAHLKFHKTEFGEADVLPNLLKKWVPDVVIDNHGIPAHEWVQPFAGYNTPPLFPVSYNVPSAKIYGIGRYLNTPFSHLHKENLQLIANQLNETFRDTIFAEENKYWRERFMKYGTQFVPEKYPIEGKDNINFYSELTVTPEYPTVTIFRYPSWVAADIISEVADEVVYDEELESCIEAQYLFNKSILQLVLESPINYKNDYEKERPIRLRGKRN